MSDVSSLCFVSLASPFRNHGKKLSSSKAYRLNEVIESYPVKESEILELVDRGQMSLFLQCENIKGIAFSVQDKEKIGHCVVSFSGLLGLSHESAKALVSLGEAEVSAGYVIEPKELRLLRTDYPFEVELPNRLLSRWQSSEPSEIKGPCYLWFDPQQSYTRKGAYSMLKSLGEHLQGRGAEIDLKSGNPFLEQLTKTSDLFAQPQKFNLRQVRITEQGVNKALEILRPIASELKDQTRKNQLVQLLERIIQARPKAQAKEVWQILLQEAGNDQTERKYDTDLILIPHSDELLKWRKLNGQLAIVNFSSFDSRLSRVRTNMGLNKG